MLKKLKQFLSKANFADDNTLESGISTGSTLSKNDIGKLPSTAEEFKDAGDKALNTNELEQAERHYKQSITINPNYADAHINLSVLYRMKRQYEEANTCLQKAKQLDPVDAYVDFNLATTAQLQGNTLLAIRHFQDAIAINNTFEIAYVDLFNLQHQLSDLSGAEKTINQALKFIPESAECHYLLGNLEKERGNLELSTTAYQQALTINPDLLQAHVFLGAV